MLRVLVVDESGQGNAELTGFKTKLEHRLRELPKSHHHAHVELVYSFEGAKSGIDYHGAYDAVLIHPKIDHSTKAPLWRRIGMYYGSTRGGLIVMSTDQQTITGAKHEGFLHYRADHFSATNGVSDYIIRHLESKHL